MVLSRLANLVLTYAHGRGFATSRDAETHRHLQGVLALLSRRTQPPRDSALALCRDRRRPHCTGRLGSSGAAVAAPRCARDGVRVCLDGPFPIGAKPAGDVPLSAMVLLQRFS